MSLFNRDGKGSEELADLTGQWYASSPYALIATEIGFATMELRALVGDAVVKKAEVSYEQGNDGGGLVAQVQLPIACLALLRYSSLSGVSHDGTGHKVKMDENEQMPWEWMVDRDEKAMRDRYYRALDALFWYLENNEVEEWTSSGLKNAISESIVGSLSQFEAVYPLDGSYYAYYRLQALVIEAQRSSIVPFLGTEVWGRITAKVPAEADAMLISLTRSLAVLMSIILAAERWPLDVLPLEIARRFSPSYQGNRARNAATVDEINWYVGGLKRQVADIKDQIRSVLNSSHIPQLLPDNDPDNKFFTTV